jgi:hypothetical protein
VAAAMREGGRFPIVDEGSGRTYVYFLPRVLIIPGRSHFFKFSIYRKKIDLIFNFCIFRGPK